MGMAEQAAAKVLAFQEVLKCPTVLRMDRVAHFLQLVTIHLHLYTALYIKVSDQIAVTIIRGFRTR